MNRQENKRQHQRPPHKPSVHICEQQRRVSGVDHGFGRRCRVPRLLASTIRLAVAAVLLPPFSYGVARGGKMGFGVLAVPCVSENATTGAGGEAGGGILSVEVTATTDLNLTSIKCS